MCYPMVTFCSALACDGFGRSAKVGPGLRQVLMALLWGCMQVVTCNRDTRATAMQVVTCCSLCSSPFSRAIMAACSASAPGGTTVLTTGAVWMFVQRIANCSVAWHSLRFAGCGWRQASRWVQELPVSESCRPPEEHIKAAFAITFVPATQCRLDPH